MITDEGVIQWAEDREDDENASRLKLFHEPTVQAFVTWVKENDDDDDDNGDDNEDDDEEGEDQDDDA